MRGVLRLTLLLAIPASAGADPAARARAIALYEEGELSRALEAFEQVLEAGDEDRRGLADIWLHLGILRAGSRDPPGAQAAFEALLALDPSAEPPRGSSPLVTEPFARARRSRSGSGALALEVDAPDSVAAGTVVTITARAHDDVALARGARALIDEEPAVLARGQPPLSLELPPEATSEAGELRYRVELLDAWGSVLDARDGRLAIEGTAAPLADEPAAAPVPRRRRSESVLASPWFWGGAVALVGGAVALTLFATSADEQAHFGAVEVVRE